VLMIYCPQLLNHSQMNEVLGLLVVVKKQQKDLEL